MATILVIQMLLFSGAIAQQQFVHCNPHGLWLHVTSVNKPIQPLSAPCLTRGQPVANRDDYTYTPGVGGHKVHTRPAVWNEARRTCEEEGGHLAIVNSIVESNAIVNLLERTEKVVVPVGNPDWFFVGFHDFFQEGEYVTIYGQSLAKAGFTKWATGQPDDTTGRENCGSLRKGDGGLNDLKCDDKYGFICEVPIH